VKLSWLLAPGPDTHVLGPRIERLSAACRFLWVVRERAEDPALVKALVDELRDIHLESVIFEMERAGVLDALDENPELTFGELRRSVIPAADAQLLANAGISEPNAEIVLLIQFARAYFRDPDRHYRNRPRLPSEQAHEAPDALKRAVDRLEQLARGSLSKTKTEAPTKPRKLFTGIGKLIAGTVTAAGNLMLATGTIIAPNPATAYGVIGSSALALGSICQGIGDLRGE
jgi:hypothetical protein